MAITPKELARRTRLESDPAWRAAAHRAAPATYTARQAFDLAHRRASAARAAAPAAARTTTPAPPAAAAQPSRADQIAMLCRDAGRPELAADLILAGATIEEARQALAVASWQPHLRAAQAAFN